MAARKPKMQDWPPECCGVCGFSTVPERREEDELVCWADPPHLAGEADENGTVVATWVRGAYVAPQMPACRLFKGRHHA